VQVRAAEYKVLAGYLLNLEELQGDRLLWAECERCKKWRLIDSETHKKIAEESYFCAQDLQRPIRGCDVLTLPSGQVQDDEEILKDAVSLVCGQMPVV
jgi:hypothetical protein